MAEAQSTQNSDIIKMVDNALNVLDLLRTNKERLGVNEIAKLCGLSPSTAFRILKTLESSGWVFQLSDDRYIPGEKLSFATEKNNFYLALSDVAYFVMNDYTAKYGQAMNLVVRKGSSCTIIQQSRTNRLVEYVPPLYSDLPFYACSAGKILLSELPIHLVDKIINSCEMRPLTPRTITDPEKFWQALRETAKQGYAFDFNESAINGSCVGVPVRDSEGTIVAALSFSGFIGVVDADELRRFLPALRDASAEISRELYVCWGR